MQTDLSEILLMNLCFRGILPLFCSFNKYTNQSSIVPVGHTISFDPTSMLSLTPNFLVPHNAVDYNPKVNFACSIQQRDLCKKVLQAQTYAINKNSQFLSNHYETWGKLKMGYS